MKLQVLLYIFINNINRKAARVVVKGKKPKVGLPLILVFIKNRRINNILKRRPLYHFVSRMCGIVRFAVKKLAVNQASK